MQNPPVGKDMVPYRRVLENHDKPGACLRMCSSLLTSQRLRESFTFLVPGFHGHAEVPGLDLTLVHRNR